MEKDGGAERVSVQGWRVEGGRRGWSRKEGRNGEETDGEGGRGGAAIQFI